MSEISEIDLAMLACMGVNGRAYDLLNSASIPELIRASQKRAGKLLSEQELHAKQEFAEKFRVQLEQFTNRGGSIVGKSAHELGGFLRAPIPPLCAYLRGDKSLLTAQTKVAIVGTRHPSQRGMARASELAANLSKAGVLVVSGGATGIDLAAHKGAIASGHPTLAILGEALKPMGDERPNRLPRERLTTATLFGPWVRPSKSLFVVRNQYVAALASAVVIIEGRPNSGTLHTARYAQQMGVPVWVIPGDPSDELSQAGNWLLEQGGARALVRIDYFLSTLMGGGSRISQKLEAQKQAEVVAKPELSPAQNAMMTLFKQNQGRMTVDELAEKCETTLIALQQELLMLELLGVIRKQGTEFIVT